MIKQFNPKFLALSLILSLGLFFSLDAQNIPLSAQEIAHIQERLNSVLVYPNIAKLNGWEGIAKVKIILNEDGRIKDINIAESSGYPLLDATAMMAVKDASPYPFPENYSQPELELIVPVNYRNPLPPGPKEKIEPYINPSFLSSSDEQEIDKPKGNFSADELDKFINIAVEKNPPIKVAQEEIELASFKVLEAQRNFLPSFKLSNYFTDGEVYKIGYEETETKAQIDQPIYYSGRLKDTLKQALVNLKITQRNYDRLRLDIVQKTEAAYYTLIASKLNLTEKELLKNEAMEVLSKVEKLGQVGMVIPLEVNSARSWFEQLENQVKGVQHEVEMAQLTLKQVLNVQELPPMESSSLEFKTVDIDLTQCVEIAFKNRPEIYLSELLAKFNDYGQKIEASKGKWMIDLTSSFGYYQGHYKTEPWRDSNNWYAGIKVVKPWGANTINSSLTHESSQPRFGQTSPTLSSTFSTEFNLLDNVQLAGDKKKASIEYARSLSDYNETLKTITFEVQDSFLKYQKAGFQLSTAESEMKFRRNEAEVTKTRASVGDSSLSSVIESIYALSEAQTRFIQAMANYYISLASLKKATGYGLEI